MKDLLQVDAIDQALRNRLWSALYDYVLRHVVDVQQNYRGPTLDARTAQGLARRVWSDFLKRRSDEAPGLLECELPIKEVFSNGDWNVLYDLMEFILAVLPPISAKPLTKKWNELLEQETAGYRIVGGEIVDIISPAEIAVIEAGLSSGLQGVQEHIRVALSCLSDKEAPDYRNSIKESISAVESICRLVGGGKTLGGALKKLRERISIHPALEKAFNALYGYTSDEGGIRHALLEESAVDSADARFMLVACSAFVNFMIAKASTSGIPLANE